MSTPPPATPTLSLAARVLSIPEILLNIFANFSTQEEIDTPSLARSALVASSWRGPSQTVLYETLEISWRFTEIVDLVNGLEANPSLFELVRICSIEEFSGDDLADEIEQSFDWPTFLRECGFAWDEPGWTDQDWHDAYDLTNDARNNKLIELVSKEVDSFWVDNGDGEYLSFITLVGFLGHLVNLRHLQLTFPFSASEIGPASGINLNGLKGCKQEISNLLSLAMNCQCTSFAQAIVSATRNLHSLELHENSSKLLLPPLAQLLHFELVWYGREFTLMKFGTSLETLTLVAPRAGDNVPIKIQSRPLPHVTHLVLILYEIETFDIIFTSSILPATRNLLYFGVRVQDVLEHPPPFDKILDLLPPTVQEIDIYLAWFEQTKIIEYQSWASTAVRLCLTNRLRLALLKRVRLLVTDQTLGPGLVGLKMEAELQGVGFDVLSLEYSENLLQKKMRESWRAMRSGFRG